MRPQDAIRMEGALLGIGDSRRILCPFCNGGQGHERSMSIKRTADGVLYSCHRVSCPSRPGFVGTGAGHVQGPREKPPEYFTGERLPLTDEDMVYFREKYEIAANYGMISRTEYGEYVLPIFAPDGSISGYNVRQPWPGAPCKGREGRPKSRVYVESARPVQSVYKGSNPLYENTVLLVEDQLSAIKAAQRSHVQWAVSLMGAHLDIPRVQEIAQLRPSEVLLALDSDATETSFKLARTSGLAFPKMRVVILDMDIKDTPAADINEVLGL
jgi:hypothetical protein